MTEKRFITNDPYGYSRIFYDGSRLDNKKVCKKLNTLAEENEKLKSDNKDYIKRYSESFDEYKKNKNEHEQLKQAYAQLKHRHSLLHDECIDAECDRDSYHKDVASLEKENEQLKQREENLLSEIDDFQELLSKNDSVYHKRVIDLIDDRISNFSNVRAELLLHSDDDYRLEKLSFAIQNLRELKKELCE